MLNRKQFIEKYTPFVLQLTKGTKIFPETLFAQAIVESQGPVNGTYYPGQSGLAKNYFNFFGIKASSAWKGPVVNKATGEVFNGIPTTINSFFRVYTSFEESAKDYIKFLQENQRYTTYGVFTAPTYQDQIKALKNAGYATGLNYISVITSVADYVNGVLKNITPGKIIGGAGLIAILGIGLYLILK